MMSWTWLLLLSATVIGLVCPGLLLLVGRGDPPAGWRVLGAWLTADPTRAQARLTGALHLSWGIGLSALLAVAGTGSFAWPQILLGIVAVLVAAAAAVLVTFRLADDLDVLPSELYSGLAWLTGVASTIGIGATILVAALTGWSRYPVICLAMIAALLVYTIWNAVTTGFRNAVQRGQEPLDPDAQEAADAAAHVERMSAMQNIGFGALGVGLAVLAVVKFLS